MLKVRGEEFCGTQNRWVSANKDITYLMRPALIAAMEATIASTEAPPGDYTKLADAVVACLNKGVEKGQTAVGAVSALRERLKELNPVVVAVFQDHMFAGFLTQHLMGVRELTSNPFVGDADMRDAVGQAIILSALPSEDQIKVLDMLKKAGAYRRAELERQAPPGEVVAVHEDAAGEDTKPA